MSLLIYMEPVTISSRAFCEAILTHTQGLVTETILDIETLALRLQEPKSEINVLVALLGDASSLETFVALHEHLEGIKVVLAISEWSTDLLVLSHTVHPRFITCLDAESNDLIAVLQKMLHGEAARQVSPMKLDISHE